MQTGHIAVPLPPDKQMCWRTFSIAEAKAM
jgi:hypothetical protein